MVITASMAHRDINKLDPKDLNNEKGEYGSFKLCNMLFSRHLSRLVEGSGVVVNSHCPGFVASEIYGKTNSSLFRSLVGVVSSFTAKSVEQGAQTMIHLAVSPEAGAVN